MENTNKLVIKEKKVTKKLIIEDMFENKNENEDKNNIENELIKLNKQELINKCKLLKIKNYSNKKKEQIITLILTNTNNQNIQNSTINNDYIYEISNIVLKPLIKWSGGKNDEIKHFQKYIPINYNYYIEPFIGGGALYFYLFPKKAVINDVHSELIDFYKSISNGYLNNIYEFMNNNSNDEITYYNIRDNMIINDYIDNAKRFYYLRKTCFRGMLRYNKEGKFNIPYGKYKTINYNELTNKNYEILLKRTEIYNNNFEYIFNNYNDENNFMFLDPPYDSEFTDYGYCKFGKEEHIKLANLFKNTKIKCLMVIGKTNFIEELYKDYIVDEYEKKYKFKLYDNRIGNEINNKHLIIKNY